MQKILRKIKKIDCFYCIPLNFIEILNTSLKQYFIKNNAFQYFIKNNAFQYFIKKYFPILIKNNACGGMEEF